QTTVVLTHLIGNTSSQNVFDERQSVCQTASSELLDGLGRADRIAEIRHHLSQQPMGNGFRINQHAITIEDYQAHRNAALGMASHLPPSYISMASWSRQPRQRKMVDRLCFVSNQSRSDSRFSLSAFRT